MARPSKIWWWEDRKCYFVKINGQRHRLDPEQKEAERMYHELKGKRKEEPKLSPEAVVTVIDEFLDWVSDNRASGTYDWYKSFLQPFARTVKHLHVGQLKPHHVEDWLKKQDWSKSTKRAAITCIKRCFSWAVKQEHIDKSPVANMEKPEAGKRDIVLSEAEYGELLNLVDERFRDLLEFTWETGARPQEVYALEARHLQLKNKRIVFPKEESKGKKRPRVIYMNPKALEIVTRLLGKGHVFLSAKGEPFTKDSVNSCFNRLQIRMGKRITIEIPEEKIKSLIPKLKKTVKERDGERPKTPSELRAEAKRKLTNKEAKKHSQKLCLYNLRHSFCHRLLTAGVDALTVSVLMGHQSPTVVATTYSHLSQADGHLLAALTKA